MAAPPLPFSPSHHWYVIPELKFSPQDEAFLHHCTRRSRYPHHCYLRPTPVGNATDQSNLEARSLFISGAKLLIPLFNLIWRIPKVLTSFCSLSDLYRASTSYRVLRAFGQDIFSGPPPPVTLPPHHHCYQLLLLLLFYLIAATHLLEKLRAGEQVSTGLILSVVSSSGLHTSRRMRISWSMSRGGQRG